MATALTFFQVYSQGGKMSSAMRHFFKITLESVFRGIIIAVIIIFAGRMGWL